MYARHRTLICIDKYMKYTFWVEFSCSSTMRPIVTVLSLLLISVVMCSARQGREMLQREGDGTEVLIIIVWSILYSELIAYSLPAESDRLLLSIRNPNITNTTETTVTGGMSLYCHGSWHRVASIRCICVWTVSFLSSTDLNDFHCRVYHWSQFEKAWLYFQVCEWDSSMWCPCWGYSHYCRIAQRCFFDLRWCDWLDSKYNLLVLCVVLHQEGILVQGTIPSHNIGLHPSISISTSISTRVNVIS